MVVATIMVIIMMVIMAAVIMAMIKKWEIAMDCVRYGMSGWFAPRGVKRIDRMTNYPGTSLESYLPHPRMHQCSGYLPRNPDRGNVMQAGRGVGGMDGGVRRAYHLLGCQKIRMRKTNIIHGKSSTAALLPGAQRWQP